MFDLDMLVAEYIEAQGGWPTITRSAGRDDWHDGTLHASDLTRCVREVGMRLRGDTPEPFPPQKIRQFWAANQQHELIYASLKHRDELRPGMRSILVEAEAPVPMPDGWSGTSDMVLAEYHNQTEDKVKLHIADSKNPHPNIVQNYSLLPKDSDIFQVTVYATFLKERYPELEWEGEAFYMPLGGAGEYKPTRFPLADEMWVYDRMAEFEAARDALPQIAPVLEPAVRWPSKGEGFSFKRKYTDKGGNTYFSGDIVLGTPWLCSYCRYQCPNRSLKTVLLGKQSKSGVELTSKGRHYEDAISLFLAEETQKWLK